VFFFYAFDRDLKGGSWQQSGGLLQPPWLFPQKKQVPSPAPTKRPYSLFANMVFLNDVCLAANDDAVANDVSFGNDVGFA